MRTFIPMRQAILCAAAAVGVQGLAMAQSNVDQSTPPIQRPGMSQAAGQMDRGQDHDAGKHTGMKAAHEEMLRTVLGATVRPLPRDQANRYRNLKPGVGLVVDDVQANSKAVTGGLKQGDVIFQVDDQWVINTPQLCTLLAIQDADDDFEVKVYRGTERVDLDFELDRAALDSMNRMHDEAAMGAPDSRTERSMTRDPVRPDMDNADRDKDRDELAGVPAGQAGLIIPEKFDYKDDDHSFVLRSEDGSKKLTIKDDDGNVLFDGPYNTQAERDAVPADLKARFEQALRAKVQ